MKSVLVHDTASIVQPWTTGGFPSSPSNARAGVATARPPVETPRPTLASMFRTSHVSSSTSSSIPSIAVLAQIVSCGPPLGHPAGRPLRPNFIWWRAHFERWRLRDSVRWRLRFGRLWLST